MFRSMIYFVLYYAILPHFTTECRMPNVQCLNNAIYFDAFLLVLSTYLLFSIYIILFDISEVAISSLAVRL